MNQNFLEDVCNPHKEGEKERKRKMLNLKIYQTHFNF